MAQNMNPVQSNPDTTEYVSTKYLVKSTCKQKQRCVPIAEDLRVELQASELRHKQKLPLEAVEALET